MSCVYLEEGSADCPALAFEFAGTDKDETEALVAVVSAWSDGYNVEATLTFEGLYFTAMATDTAVEYAFGNELTTATAAPNGAYVLALGWAMGATTADIADTDSQLMTFYMPTAAVTSEGDLGADSSDVVGIYYDNGTTELKYGWTQTPTTIDDSSTEDIATGATLAGKWYMPKEADAEGETTATGDRLDKKDEITAWAGADGAAADTKCGDGAMKVKLGAATLAAGSIALAAALAF